MYKSKILKIQLRIFVSHHVLHTDADLPIAVKGPIKAHNVGGVAFMQHLQLSDNLVPDGRFDFQVDQLRGVNMKPLTTTLTKSNASDDTDNTDTLLCWLCGIHLFKTVLTTKKETGLRQVNTQLDSIQA